MAESPPSDVAAARLRVGETIFPLSSDRQILGRSRSCDIRLRADTVSRLHAAFIWQGAELVLEDLGSTNGTYVNGQRVQGPRSVTPGDVVHFGAVRGELEGTLPAPTPPPAEAAQRVGDYTVGLVEGRPASLPWRLLAALLDSSLFAIGSVVPFGPYLVVRFSERYLLSPEALPPSVETKAILAGGCVVLWILYAWYYVVHGWAKRGGTPGMRLCGLRLLDYQHRVPIGYGRTALRLAASLLTLLTGGLGFLLIAFRPDRRALHDVIARTSVAHRPRMGFRGPV